MSANLPRTILHTLYYSAKTGGISSVVILQIKTHIQRLDHAQEAIASVVDRWVRTTKDGHEAYLSRAASIYCMVDQNLITRASMTDLLLEAGIELLSTEIANVSPLYGDATVQLVKESRPAAASSDNYRVWARGDRVRAGVTQLPYPDKGGVGTVIYHAFVKGRLQLEVRWDERSHEVVNGAAMDVSWIDAGKATYLPPVVA